MRKDGMTLGLGEAPAALAAAPHGLGAWLIRRALSCIESGRLSIVTPDGARYDHAAATPGAEATLVIHDWRALRRLARSGDIGFAEGYIAGDWSSPDLVALITLVAENVAHLQRVMDGWAPVRLASRLKHLARRNSASGSRRNIAFHYDLGNDFYRHWLDASMTYSSALRVRPGQTLEAAQAEKLARIAALLAPGPQDRVLEIGCGWGALAAHLAGHAASVTGVTLSREQLDWGRRSVADLGDRVDLRLQDYRAVTETYDRIVSIEMIEAVGERYWPVYFDKLRACLAPGGRAVLQVITIREDRFDAYRSGSDFIQRYIFPGGMLLTSQAIAREAGRAGLRLADAETFGIGYAETLAEWRRRFDKAWPDIARLGFDDRFRRLWDYYLCYCEAGFRAGTIDVGLYVLEA